MMESIKKTAPVDLPPEVVTKSTLIEASKDDAVNLVPEVVDQSNINESNEINEPSDVIHEIVPKSTLIEDSKVTDPVNLVFETIPQNAKVETPIKAESGHLVDAERKQTKSRKESKKPTPKTRDHGSKITDVEGIGPTYAKRLNSIGIYTTSDLLESGATPRGRRELAEKTDITHNLILEWVNLSDLLRVKGIGEEYSDLLEEAGVDTVVELSHRNAVNLHARVLEVNMAKKLVRRTPSLSMVERWISEAKNLPRKIEY
jgi:predicted flap endonuclease-1-like 5' DNA nuclease